MFATNYTYGIYTSTTHLNADELTMSHEHQSEEDTATIQRLVRTRARAPHVPHSSDDLTSVPRPSQFAMPYGLVKLGLGPDTKLVAAFIAQVLAANNPGCIPSLSEPRPLRTPAIWRTDQGV